MLEGCDVKMFTDQKPLTSAFFKAKEPLTNCQRNQLSFISEFRTDIAHVPGVDNVVADTLSRQYGDTQDLAMVNTVAHRLVDVDLEELAGEQDEADIAREIGPESALTIKSVKIPGIDKRLWCDVSTGKPRIYVPEPWRKKVFQAVHSLSHPSGRATLMSLATVFVWRSMNTQVKQWAKQCESCGKNKVTRHAKPPLLPIPVPATRFEHVHVDLVGPFPVSQGKRYILTMIDRTTRWVEAAALADSTASSITAAFISNWPSRFGIPKVVTSDRGAQFTSQTWTQLLGRLGVKASTTTAYYPQANGMVERFHRTLKSALWCVLDKGTWTSMLPWVLLGIRNAPREDTATSSAEVLYGLPIRIPGMCFSDRGESHTPRQELLAARANVKEFLPRLMDKKKAKYSPFVPQDLKKAEFVYVRNEKLGKSALTPCYEGPFRVISKETEKGIYKIITAHGADNVSLQRLKAAFLV